METELAANAIGSTYGFGQLSNFFVDNDLPCLFGYIQLCIAVREMVFQFIAVLFVPGSLYLSTF